MVADLVTLPMEMRNVNIDITVNKGIVPQLRFLRTGTHQTGIGILIRLVFLLQRVFHAPTLRPSEYVRAAAFL